MLGSTASTMAPALAQNLVSRAQTMSARSVPPQTQAPATKASEGVHA
jgi:hypothetical protein